MKKILTIILSFTLVTTILIGCDIKNGSKDNKESAALANSKIRPTVKGNDFKFYVNPETFKITIESNGIKEKVSEELPKMEVSDFKKSDKEASWKYPKENIGVEVKKENDNLNVKIKSNKEGNFTWPKVAGESYVLPLGEGKLIPNKDAKWKEFLNERSYTVSEGFSMQFFVSNKEKYSLVYVIENMFNNEINFDTKDKIKFDFSHEFSSVNKEKEYGFRIYVTSKNLMDAASIYKGYVCEKGKFTTLEEKAKANENIKKLYGAPHIYLWGNGNSIDLLKDINKSGIKNAWLGFDNWTTGLINPEFVKYANENGYLVGAYDSYHSIHEKGDDNWITASFKDKSLYENSTISNKSGKKIGGFLGRGRKLNPTLSMPSVKERMEEILGTGAKFNSWFIDCDAAGELYDDYTPNHITTQEQDMKARLKRMEYIRDDKKMVIGSEGGNDYASQTIAFAHGIETPVIAWEDKDMRENKESEYYVGGYFAPQGGIPPRYSKQVPIKDLYKNVYIDPTYSLPLFKMVYNNSVITTHHWEWGSLKIKDETKDRMLYEVLYNVPPLYHLDKKTWEENKSLITAHVNTWSSFHKKAITREMTGFKVLSEDRLVQMAQYGDKLKVVANFSNKDFKYDNDVIKAKSLIIYDSNNKTVYQP